jgi:hypothetical protein
MTLVPRATLMPLKTTPLAIVATRAMTIESLARDELRKDAENGGKFSTQLTN